MNFPTILVIPFRKKKSFKTGVLSFLGRYCKISSLFIAAVRVLMDQIPAS